MILKSMFVASVLTFVHSWYPMECCRDTDCKPVVCEELVELPDGSIKYSNYVFAKTKIKPSQDKNCHVCIFKFPTSNVGTPLCVFVLMGT